MNILAYKFFTFLFIVACVIGFLIGLLVIAVSSSGDVAPEAPVVVGVIVGLPIIVIGIIRGRLSSKFEVRKHLSEIEYNKAINRIRENERNNRSKLSNSSNNRNIDPLIDISKRELISRKKYVTPDAFERTEAFIDSIRSRNDITSLTSLYEIIIGTHHNELSVAIYNYLKKTEIKA